MEHLKHSDTVQTVSRIKDRGRGLGGGVQTIHEGARFRVSLVFTPSRRPQTPLPMNAELQVWLRVKADCEASIEKHGAIIEALTDRGQLVIRSNPAIASLAQAKRMIEKLRKEENNQMTLEL